MKSLFSSGALVLASVIKLGAATFFVSPSGNNSNTGASGSPWATLDFALSRPLLRPNDVIQLSTGSFPEFSSTEIAGEAGKPITIRGSGTNSTILRGKVTVDHSWYVIENLTIDGHTDGGAYTGSYLALRGPNCRNVTVENVEFLRGVMGASCQGVSGAFPTNVTIRNCRFHHPTGNGMVALVGSSHVVESSTFHDSAGNDAVRVFGPDMVIRSNRFFRIVSPLEAAYTTTSTTSASFGVGTKVFTIRDAVRFSVKDQLTILSASDPTKTMTGFCSAYTANTLSIDVYASEGAGTEANWVIQFTSDGNHADIIQSFKDSNNHPTTNLTFIANYAEDCSSQFGNVDQNEAGNLSGNWMIANNVFNRCRLQLNCYLPAVKVFNNTFFDTTGWTTGIRAADGTGSRGAAHGMLVFNNLFVRIGGTETGGGAVAFSSRLSGCQEDYNVFTDLDTSGFDSLNEGSNSLNGGFSPQDIFVNPSAGDFRLASNSPARRKGTNLSHFGFATDFNGTRRGGVWDIGAFSSALVESPDNLRVSETQANP